MTIYEWMQANLRNDAMILEIGAHHAEDSERFLQMLGGCRVIAWEPDPRNIPIIKRKNRRLGTLPPKRFVLVPSAVGAHDGHTEFFLSTGVPSLASGEDLHRDWTYSSSIRRPKNHLMVYPSVQFEQVPIRVPIMQLDTWFDAASKKSRWFAPFGAGRPEQDRIDFVWADVQGAEGDLIKGATRTLARTQYLFTEFDDLELYEGQINKGMIMAMMPGWEEVETFENNVLLRNRNLC